MIRLLIGTDNPGKKREYQQLLAALPVELCTPRDLGLCLEIREDGDSYAHNARTKALSYVRASRILTLADDSGLEVDAVGGEPGPLSARYAGAAATDVDRYRLLLHRLNGIPWQKRTARFRCVLALAMLDGRLHITEGTCEGIIAWEPHGSHGFGYDPIFYLPEYGQTMAQLPPEVKNRISHRAHAVRQILPILSCILTQGSATDGQ